MRSRLIIFTLLFVVLLTSILPIPYSERANASREQSQILITYPKSIGTFDIFEVKIEIKDPIIKQDLKSITFSKVNFDDSINILSNKDQSTACRSRLLYRYEGKTLLHSFLKPISSNLKLPYSPLIWIFGDPIISSLHYLKVR